MFLKVLKVLKVVFSRSETFLKVQNSTSEFSTCLDRDLGILKVQRYFQNSSRGCVQFQLKTKTVHANECQRLSRAVHGYPKVTKCEQMIFPRCPR